MAGLISTGIWGFICSMLPTGERDEKGRPIMEEHFNTGFAGWGWKIWKTVAGFFRLEIDELVVRRTMTVFELLIQKIRAVKGAYAITQANGKIKTVELSTDGTAYLITLEESDMSFVEHDLIRCQEFMNTQKFYHVEIESITAGVIRIPTSEFDTSTANIPMPGDEIVQFGNSSHDQQYAGRHSAIYMHADESGQPAIDVMFDIYSKDWDGCVKTRVGGEIPGSNGSRGFYCENGMIKGVNNTGHPVYCIYPDGSAMFGDGSAQFNTDKSGYIAGGAIKWRWDDTEKKHVCTMPDVMLSWSNLSDEAKEALKEETLPDFVKEWDKIGNKTLIDGEYIVSPKMFSGTSSDDGKLTGIAQGRECITIKGEKRTGLFALVDGEPVFELDPVMNKYVFKGRIEANEGVIGGFQIDDYGLSNDKKSEASIYINTEKGAEKRMAALGNRIPASSGIDSASMFVSSGDSENRAVAVSASGCSYKYGIWGGNANFAIDAYGGVLWNCKKGDHWCMPGVLCAAEIDGNTLALVSSWGNGLQLIGIKRNNDKSLTITHNLGHSNYFISAMAYGTTYDNEWHETMVQYYNKVNDSFTLFFKTAGNDVATPKYFSFIIFGLPAGTT